MDHEEMYCVTRCVLRKLFEMGITTVEEAIAQMDEMYFVETGQMERPSQ